MNKYFSLFALLAALPLSACSSAVPPELVDARAAYQKAQASQAVKMAPAELDTAGKALDKAEQAFREEGDESRTRHLAYIAHRKSELAIAQGDLISATRDKEAADKNLVDSATRTAERRTDQLKGAQGQLEKTKEQLDAEKVAREEAERKRVEAERRLRDAMARLSAIATMKDEPRGLVITLPGGVLFESNKSALLGTAQEKLNQVADALLQNRDATMVVEGHTDSQGDDASNQKLSEDRAKSVREYLVGRGIAADRITAVGKGESTPIASNNTPEGRANNRRVEIIVSGAKAPTQAIVNPMP